jgi:gamma-glutamylcysteine synthetase
MEIINKNDNQTTLFGRKKDLKLFKSNNEKIKLSTWGYEIFEKLSLISKILDKSHNDNRYQKSIDHELKKIQNINLLPSSMIVNEIKKSNRSFINFGLEKIKKNLKGEKHELQSTRL